MLKSHQCEVCSNMIATTRYKRGKPNYPKSQREINKARYCSRQCYYLSNEGKKYNIKSKPFSETITNRPEIDLINRWALGSKNNGIS